MIFPTLVAEICCGYRCVLYDGPTTLAPPMMSDWKLPLRNAVMRSSSPGCEANTRLTWKKRLAGDAEGDHLVEEGRRASSEFTSENDRGASSAPATRIAEQALHDDNGDGNRAGHTGRQIATGHRFRPACPLHLQLAQPSIRRRLRPSTKGRASLTNCW